MITARELSCSHQRGTFALREVSFFVARGELYLVAGANGSGKSTLLQLLAGLLTPSSGSAQVGEVTLPGGEKSLRARSALCLQDPDLQILGATAREDLLLCLPASLPKPAVQDMVQEMAVRFRLGHCLDAAVHTLSHGQKRKLCLATALLTQQQRSAGAPVLLLDEPLSGLDYPAIKELRQLLQRNKAQGVTQLVASHDLEPLADLADGLALLHQGRMPHVGPVAEVLAHARECGVRPPCGWKPGQPAPAWS